MVGVELDRRPPGQAIAVIVLARALEVDIQAEAERAGRSGVELEVVQPRPSVGLGAVARRAIPAGVELREPLRRRAPSDACGMGLRMARCIAFFTAEGIGDAPDAGVG